MIKVPKWANYIIDKLQENNYKAYAVGGCVRDSLLSKEPNDWDITTSARPEDTIKMFEELGYKVVPTGLKHGTVTVMIEKIPYEITTFRIEGDYSDGRHPDKVEFTNDLREDLSRRDFTINAMAFNSRDGLMDYFSGKDDLSNKIIRCVGNANERFNEDALRMLRAIRFSAQLGFQLEGKTGDAIKANHELIKNVSKERIQIEINKILLSDNPDYIAKLDEYKLLQHIIPEYSACFKCEQNNPYHIYNVGVHIQNSIKHIEKNLALRLTMLFHDIGKPLCKTTDEKGIDHFYIHPLKSADITEEILRGLKYDNDTIKKVTTLVKFHDAEVNKAKQIRKILSKIGEENFLDLLKVKEADMKAQDPNKYEEKHEKLLIAKSTFDRVIEENNCFKLKDLKLNGRNLIELGVKDGRMVGSILNKLLEIVIEKPELNDKEKLLNYIEENKLV